MPSTRSPITKPSTRLCAGLLVLLPFAGCGVDATDPVSEQTEAIYDSCHSTSRKVIDRSTGEDSEVIDIVCVDDGNPTPPPDPWTDPDDGDTPNVPSGGGLPGGGGSGSGGGGGENVRPKKPEKPEKPEPTYAPSEGGGCSAESITSSTHLVINYGHYSYDSGRADYDCQGPRIRTPDGTYRQDSIACHGDVRICHNR